MTPLVKNVEKTKLTCPNKSDFSCAVGSSKFPILGIKCIIKDYDCKMNDRLGELWGNDEVPSWAKEGGGGPSSDQHTNHLADNDSEDGEKGNDLEWGDPLPSNDQQQPTNGQPKFMESFFKDVDGIKADIDAIRNATKRVGEINEEAILATSTAKEEELSNQLKPLIDQTNKRAKRTKNLLALLKEENQKLKDEKTVKASDMR